MIKGDFTGLKQASSKRRMVCLSTAPTSCRPSLVSSIAASASVRYFLGTMTRE